MCVSQSVGESREEKVILSFWRARESCDSRTQRFKNTENRSRSQEMK